MHTLKHILALHIQQCEHCRLEATDTLQILTEQHDPTAIQVVAQFLVCLYTNPSEEAIIAIPEH